MKCEQKGCKAEATHTHSTCRHFDCESQRCIERWCEIHQSQCAACRWRRSLSDAYQDGAEEGARLFGHEDPPL